ncbi:MAG TPA: hypothetical protein VLG27_01135 [Candidatus Saccharimonadia bacterium]|nr:hypothetical protein [Candidatus Saccharimonadia bacterium]
MKLLLKIVLLAINGLLSVTLIAFGSGYANITDADPTKSPLAVVVGVLVILSLVILSILGKSNKNAEIFFWYLGIGFPVVTFLWLLVG